MHRRQLFSLAVAAGIAVSGSACKKKDDGSAGSAGAARAEASEIVIGHYASMTGSTAHFGQDTDKAARLAVDQLNEAGGVLGKKLKIVTLDTRGDGAEAAQEVRAKRAGPRATLQREPEARPSPLIWPPPPLGRRGSVGRIQGERGIVARGDVPGV